jgi:alkylation response protein AidB-like acyl-CoA dehydrogenase
MSALDVFRHDARAWLDANCPDEMRQPLVESGRCWGGKRWKFVSEGQRIWLERMVSKGWTVPEWPSEYGGAGLSTEEAIVLAQEMRRLGCRRPLDSLGIWMLGPALLKFGTDQQKKTHLPPIARGEIRWCQGYSEPGAGSDLVSLTTRAETRADGFVVNGQKIWTSFADQADWIFCLVRTDPAAPKSKGISFLLIDMATPGIRAKPIELIFGKSDFCEVFFEDVFVPSGNLVGAINFGWDIAKYLLSHERASIAGNKRFLGEESPGAIAATKPDIAPHVRYEIASYEVDAWALECAAAVTDDMRQSGLLQPAYSSVLKYASAELHKRKHELLMSLDGMVALEEGDDPSRMTLRARDWLKSKANSIEGGTAEIQLNIIAKRLLGLPS